MIFNLITKAKELFYSNNVSGLNSLNVQDAIDEVNSALDTKSPLAGSSSLTKCNKGNFGTAAAANTTTSIASGGTGLPTGGTVYTALSKKSNVISQATVSKDNITIAKNNYVTGEISAVKSGYTPVCVVGFNITTATTSGSGDYYAVPYAVYLSGTTVKYKISNYDTANSIKVKINACVLYVKD